MTRIVAFLVVALVLVAGASLSHGDFPVPPGEILRILAGDPEANPQSAMIVMEFRLPRILSGVLIGVALAVAGAITQALMRNPLAEPGIIGINSGAALAAVIVIIYLGGTSLHLLPWLSFVGALAMTIAIYVLSWRDGTTSIRIILVGIGLNAMAGGAAIFVSTLGDVTQMQQAMVWLSGSVYDSSWNELSVTALWLAPPLLLTLIAARELDVISFSDDAARSLGQRVNFVRASMMILCALISGAAVASAGLIGFVGLIAPHLARRLVGHGHARIIPVAGLAGGLLLLTADFLGRILIAPAQLPAGLMTAILGAPFFFYLLWKRQNA